MKQKKRAISFLLLVLLLRVTIHAFTHPGLYNNKTELDFIKKMVNEGKQPWKSGYDKMLKKVPGSFSPRADAIVGYGCSGTAAPGSWYLDGAYAYGYALQWYIKGDTNKRDNALRILNAWADALQEFKVCSGFSRQYRLVCPWGAHRFLAAAEIMRYSNSGWSAAGIERFISMMHKACVPILREVSVEHQCGNCQFACPAVGAPQTGNGNTIGLASLMGFAVFTDDRPLYEECVNHWKNIFVKYGMYPNGENGESCRDLTHAAMNVVGLIQIAEIARHQGTDLYGMNDNRLALVVGYNCARQNGKSLPTKYSWNGSSCPPRPGCGTTRGKSWTGITGYEMAYNYYNNFLDLEMPETGRLVKKIRPEPNRWNYMGWSTLTHAQLPKTMVSNLTRNSYSPIKSSGREPEKPDVMVFWDSAARAGTSIQIVDICGRASNVNRTAGIAVIEIPNAGKTSRIIRTDQP